MKKLEFLTLLALLDVGLSLKVGSCPNDDSSVQIFYLSFFV